MSDRDAARRHGRQIPEGVFQFEFFAKDQIHGNEKYRAADQPAEKSNAAVQVETVFRIFDIII